MKPADFNIDELIDSLQGTTQSISDALPEGMDEDDLTQKDYNKINNAIFLCETCGWWCETSEANENPNGGEDLCDDCNESEEDE